MKKENFPDKCIVCYDGHNCCGKGIDKLNDIQIDELSLIIDNIEIDYFMYPCKCNAADTYEAYSKYIPHLEFFKKYQDKINYLRKWQLDTYNVEEFIFDIHDNSIELFWLWENDNGLYTNSGCMKALYHHEEDDKTWSKSETKSLIKYFGLKYKQINSLEDFLKHLTISE